METEFKRLLELNHGVRVLARKEEIKKEAEAIEKQKAAIRAAAERQLAKQDERYNSLVAELKGLKIFTEEDEAAENFAMNYEEDMGRVARGEKPLHFFLHPNGELSVSPPAKVKKVAKTKLVPVLDFDGLPMLDGKGGIKMKRVPA